MSINGTEDLKKEATFFKKKCIGWKKPISPNRSDKRYRYTVTYKSNTCFKHTKIDVPQSLSHWF